MAEKISHCVVKFFGEILLSKHALNVVFVFLFLVMTNWLNIVVWQEEQFVFDDYSVILFVPFGWLISFHSEEFTDAPGYFHYFVR